MTNLGNFGEKYKNMENKKEIISKSDIKEENIRISVIIPRKTHQKIVEIAKNNDRSFSNVVRIILNNAESIKK